MKILCIIGLVVILAFIFLAAVPAIMAVTIEGGDNYETGYIIGLISSIIIIISVISVIAVNFYFTPENFGYQKIVSENSVESEE